MKIVVGLGNPGEQYEKTRHNVGWLIIDEILGDVSWSINKKLKLLSYESGGIIFVKPQTYMNNSGQAVRGILDYYKLLPRKIPFFRSKNFDLSDTLVVIHDDLDIDFGKIKTSIDSRSAGHNGVQSVINYLKTKNFKRIRIGIKNNKNSLIPTDKFVLQKFSKEELKEIINLKSKVKTEI